MDVRIPPLKVKTLLESNPVKSRILVGGLAVGLIPEARLQTNSGLLLDSRAAHANQLR